MMRENVTTTSSKSTSKSQLTTDVEGGAGNQEPSSGHYMLRHWRGDLPLGRSCWCNGLSAFLALPIFSAGVTATVHLWSKRPGNLRIAALMLTLFFALWLGLQVWSNVGMWRAAKHYFLRGGRRLWTRAARGLVVSITAFDLALLLIVANSPRREIAMIAWGRDPIGTIHVELSQDGTRVLVLGNLGAGSAAELARVLRSTGHARTVELTSNGGRMYEANCRG